MELIVYSLIIISVGFLVWGFLAASPKVILRQPVYSSELKIRKHGDFLGRIFPSELFLRRMGMDVKLKNALEAAHTNLSVQAFFNLKILICLLLVGAVVAITGKAEPPLVVIAIAAGFILPDFYLKRMVAKRKALIVRGLPETVDLLGLCIEAGLDFVNAAKWVIDKTPRTPMTEELLFVIDEIKWGKPRVQALKDMSRRLEIREITSFVQTIIQAERMGTPIAEAFTILSEDARAQRFHRGERIALQAPIKILFPLIFFIMPVIGIIVGGPILMTFMQGGIAGLK